MRKIIQIINVAVSENLCIGALTDDGMVWRWTHDGFAPLPKQDVFLGDDQEYKIRRQIETDLLHEHSKLKK